MKIMIDGDSCCVMKLTEQIAHEQGIECHIYSDTSRVLTPAYDNVFMHVVDKGPNSVDFTIVNSCSEGDIVITNDIGLAALVLTKKCAVISPYGMEFTNDNIAPHLTCRNIRSKLMRKRPKQSYIRGCSLPREKRNYKKTLTAVMQRMECVI